MSKLDNKYELAEWVAKKAMTMIQNKTDSLLQKQKKLHEREIKIDAIVQQAHQCIDGFNKSMSIREKAINDRTNNLQLIYDKMLEIEKKINQGTPLNKTDDDAEKIRSIPISDIVFSARTHRILTKNMGLKTLGDIALQTVQGVYMQNGFGNACFKEVKEVLNSYNICLREK